MSEDTTNNVATATAPTDEEPATVVPTEIPAVEPVPEVTVPETEIEKSL